MIYPMVPFSVTLRDHSPRFQGHGVITEAIDVSCAQLTRDLFAIAKFLYMIDCVLFSVFSLTKLISEHAGKTRIRVNV